MDVNPCCGNIIIRSADGTIWENEGNVWTAPDHITKIETPPNSPVQITDGDTYGCKKLEWKTQTKCGVIYAPDGETILFDQNCNCGPVNGAGPDLPSTIVNGIQVDYLGPGNYQVTPQP